MNKKTALCILGVIAFIALAIAINIWPRPNSSSAAIDYGTSQSYSHDDRVSAANAILDEFYWNWQGCELEQLSYAGDESSGADTVAWVNGIAREQDQTAHFDEAIVFVSSFRTGDNPGEGLSPNERYTQWRWYLAREADRPWTVVTQGQR